MSVYDETDDMCPNCVTPWKCNGPHLSDKTPAVIRERAAAVAAMTHLPRPRCRGIRPEHSVHGYYCVNCGQSLIPAGTWWRHGDVAVVA